MFNNSFTKIPDTSNFIGKEFVFTDIFKTDSNISFCAGIKFKIVKIKNGEVTIKIISTVNECEPAIRTFAKIVSNDYKSEIKVFDKIINIWIKDKDKFVVDKNSYWNKIDDSTGLIGHCINTGYNIPKNHPNSSGSNDGFITADYKHTGKLKNIYSYQAGRNYWYSQECYEFMRLAKIETFNSFNLLDDSKMNQIYKSYFKNKNYSFSISKFNKGKFK